MSHGQELVDEALARLDPGFRIEELEAEVAHLRRLLDREIAGRLFAEELIARGARPPEAYRFRL